MAWAFALSLAFHLALFGGWHTVRKFGWLKDLRLPSWMQPAKVMTQLLQKKEPGSRPEEIPLMFVDVSPVQATAEPPADAKYYSDRNSKAANPEPKDETGVPRIDGKQTDLVRTEDVPRERFTPLRPGPKAPESPQPQEEQLAKATPPPGDLTMARPSPPTDKPAGEAKESRPRTIKEAMARQPDHRLPGEKMRQEGGMRRRLEIASLDAKATPLGTYDRYLVEVISQRWFSLLDERDYASDARGKVVLQFNMYYDGRVAEMQMAENTASEVLGLICEKAVMDPAPFDAWPTEMRRLLGNVRHVRFTFFYN